MDDIGCCLPLSPTWQLHRQCLILIGFYRATLCYCSIICRSVSVHVITCQYCVKTAKTRIMQTAPHNSQRNLVFWRQRSWQNSNEVIPNLGAKCRSYCYKTCCFHHTAQEIQFPSAPVINKQVQVLKLIKHTLKMNTSRNKYCKLVKQKSKVEIF